MRPKRSLLLITVDCFRADHAGFLGYERPTTPFLDSLARESVVFSNAIVAGAPTYFSFPSIMASRDPLSLGRDVIGLAPAEPSIEQIEQARRRINELANEIAVISEDTAVTPLSGRPGYLPPAASGKRHCEEPHVFGTPGNWQPLCQALA